MTKKIISLFLCFSISIAVLIGCSKESNGDLMNFSLTSDPNNLDPQIATDYNAVLIIKNIFEGLMTISDDGNLISGVADNYEVSDDNLTYIFYLRKDTKWMYYKTDDEDLYNSSITAHDFVFAFQRLMNPDTGSTYATDFYCIKNAQDVNSGRIDISELGVTAIDDYTLRIKLDYTNAMFLELLTSSAAMPCNQEFFEKTIGKYGLDINSILSNGPFYINSWLSDSYVRIRKSSVYSSEKPVVASGVNLSVRSDDEVLEALNNETIDTGILNYSEYLKLSDNQFNSIEFENIVWGIGFNFRNEILLNSNIRKAFAASIDYSNIESHLPEDATLSKTIVPPDIQISQSSFRELAGYEGAYTFDPDQARAYLEQGNSQLEASSTSDLTIIVPEEYEEIFQYISQTWQKELKIFLKIETLSAKDYNSRLSTKDYDLAFLSFSSDTNTPSSILSKFSSDSSNNVLSYKSSPFDDALDSSIKAVDIDNMTSGFIQSEQILLQDAVFMPIFFQKEYFVTRTGIFGVVFDSSSKIPYFKYAKKS